MHITSEVLVPGSQEQSAWPWHCPANLHEFLSNQRISVSWKVQIRARSISEMFRQ